MTTTIRNKETDTTFDIKLNFGIAEKIKDKLAIDLVDDEPKEIVNKLMIAPSKRLEMIWHMATAHDLERDAFNDLLDSDTILQCEAGFWEELENFSLALSEQRAAEIRMVKDQAIKTNKMMLKAAEEMFSGPEVEKAMEEMLDSCRSEVREQIGNLSTSFQERLDSEKAKSTS